MNNIVQSLREMLPDTPWDHDNGVIAEAADEVERLQAIVDQVVAVAKTEILPDGDHVNLSTAVWLEELAAEAKGGE